MVMSEAREILIDASVREECDAFQRRLILDYYESPPAAIDIPRMSRIVQMYVDRIRASYHRKAARLALMPYKIVSAPDG